MSDSDFDHSAADEAQYQEDVTAFSRLEATLVAVAPVLGKLSVAFNSRLAETLPVEVLERAQARLAVCIFYRKCCDERSDDTVPLPLERKAAVNEEGAAR